jgi:Zn-dependent peptidase ImmA (M78 family)
MSKSIELSKKRAKRFFEIKKLTLPIDIEKVIKDYADIEEDNIPYNVDAICINQTSRPLIVLKKNVSQNRRRFTLAHELGHIQIPWHTGMLSCHTEDNNKLLNSNKYNLMEREANTFAAEILMPQVWLEKLVIENSECDIEELTTIICEQAQVSFTAAFYNLLNVLTAGYIVFIENKIEDYMHKKETGTEIKLIYLFDEESNYDNQWIEFNSFRKGVIKNEILDIYWFKYNYIQDNVIEKYIGLLSKDYDLSRLLRDTINLEGYSCAYTLRTIRDKLPSGYILKLLFKPTRTYRYLIADKTYVSPDYKDDRDTWYDKYCNDESIYEDDHIIIKWWYFKTAYDFKLNIYDKRDSKTILRYIIDSWYTGRERVSVFGKVNGVCGSLNNNKSKMEPKEFYSVLRQKFLGKENLRYIVEHSDFNQFLVKKTLELYKK